MNNIKDLFYNKILFNAEIDSMIWNLWKYVKYNEVSSRRTQKSLETKIILQQIAKFVSKSTVNIINRDSKKIKLYSLKFSTNSLNSSTTSQDCSNDQNDLVETNKNFATFFAQIISFEREVDEREISMINHEEIQTLEANTIIFNIQRMTLKNNSLIPNFKSRWWQTYIADKAINHVENFNIIKINMNLIMSIR